ncbi:unnamed protein product [Rhizoctonia solani]|uniref:Condensin complex subunit 2 n=2 Tax=Rhizoctonia solani TaxID=456999 RepID=A0A8H3A797_9AGAM|nr:condensin complex subunit 2 [Rhizoctonia solani 123E]CAE6402264.1 unnamed protein product [Rhizoctonia solani]CAE6529919.1 unnamed protein product [Rhizoctonia solani]
MPARKRASSDTEMEDDEYDEGAGTSSKMKDLGKNKRRVSMLREAEGSSRSKSITMKSMDSSGLAENDDLSEKRRRRQSRAAAALIAEEEADGGSSSGAPRTPKKTAVARANMLNAVDHTPLPAVSMDVMTSNFEEWMKMATDNASNALASNSWNFALIDYFHDMSLLRNAQDGSVNFQKASYTLDGCVKVWTSRVDSCRNDTGKLLSNLTNDAGGGDEDEEGAEEGEGDGEEGGRTQAKRKRAHRPENTLAKSIEQLQVKKLDTECVVDPLFKKTSADFDEGGAGGMLMNHLSVDAQLQIVFDASGTRLLDEEEAEIEDGEVPLADLRAKFMPDLEELEDRTIMPSLSDFKFASDDLTFASHVLPSRNTPDEPMAFGEREPGGMADGDAPAPVEDFFTGGEAVRDYEGGFHGGGGFDGDVGDDGVGDMGDMGDYTANATGVNRTGPVEPFDPRRGRDERTLIMSMSEDATEMLDYFDTTAMKNWAGPQHWKVKRAIRKDGDTTGNTTTRSRKDKTVFMIDFETPPGENIAKKLFVPATKAVLTLPSAKTAKKGSKGAKSVKKNDFLLPNDMHFSSMQLLTLFTKPKFMVQMRRVNVGEPIKGEDGEIGGEFWAQAALDNAGPDDTDNSFPAPFATQFFHDDDDEGGFDDGDGGDGGITAADEEDLIAATQGTLKRVRPEHINYTKRAKRVDVRMLKENIWKGLNIVVPKREDDEHDEETIATPDDAEPTDPAEAREFTSVISNLRTQYPKDKLDEISTSFCFICLLHLANERGLKIQVGDTPDWATGKNVVVDDDADAGADDADVQRIGELSRLQVYRDPDARPAA